MKIEISNFKDFIESNISGMIIVNPFWLEHLLNLFFQEYLVEFQEEIWNTQYLFNQEIKNNAYRFIGQEFDEKHINLKPERKLWLRNLDCGHSRETNIAFLCKDYTKPEVGENCFCRECIREQKIISVEEVK